MSLRPVKALRAIAAVSATVALLALAPAAATAASYPPASDARSFDNGAGGWTASSSFDGVCLGPLLCPNATNSAPASGGADGGGYIQSDLLGVVGVTAVGGTTTAVWQSPRFTYGGDGAARFEMDRRSNVDQLLAVSGNSATYSVRLVDVGAGGEATRLIAPTSLAGADTWTGVSPRRVESGLVAGHDYRILIVTTYVTGTSVLVTGSADYDNVVLRDGSGAASGANGGGSGAGDGASASAIQRLLELLRGATPDTAAVVANGKRLLVRVKCPRKAGRTCRITTQGLLRKGRPATVKRTVRVRRGKAKLVPLTVKARARQAVAKRKRLLVKQKVRVGRVSATLTKKRTLIRR